jgi:uracil-DNA glycosylase
MIQGMPSSAAPFIPERPTLRTLREAVQGCRGCDLYPHATQAVFGDGPKSSEIVLVGEQPGDEEDRQGRPFVGPAGKLLDRGLADAEIDRGLVYVTNAVKHFKFEERGKRRLHKKPNGSEIKACRPWLEAELNLLRPRILVCLGATAAQAIFGNAYRVTQERGLFVVNSWAPHATSTVHPLAILRAPDDEQRHAEYRKFVDDLKKVQRLGRPLGRLNLGFGFVEEPPELRQKQLVCRESRFRNEGPSPESNR